MKLSVSESDTIRESFSIVSKEKLRAADIFYDHLFSIAPETRHLFVTDMALQRVKLMNTLGFIVSQLHDWNALEPIVEDLALRHVAYGVKERDYAAVGRSLNAMLSAMLEERYTAEVEAAWSKAYAGLAKFMIKTAYRHPD